MVLTVPSLESFVREARDGGAAAVWVCRKIEARPMSSRPAPDTRSNGGLRFWRARFTATALGRVAALAGETEKALIRWERDFGWVLEDAKAGGPPEDYRDRVVKAEQEICSRLEAEGFQVRQGEIEAV